MQVLSASRPPTDERGDDTLCQHDVAEPLANRNAAAGPRQTSRGSLDPFREIWAVDFEFGPNFKEKPGENPEPVCLVAWELRSGQKLRLWQDQFGAIPPYPTGPEALFVAYYASAEIGCHLALGWPVPERVLDLFTEFRNHTNGVSTSNGSLGGGTKTTPKASVDG